MTSRRHSDTARHPGILLGEELEARGMSQRELARRMSRPYQVVNDILRGRKAITPETALSLEGVLEGISADFWLKLQMEHDLILARERRRVAAVPA
jgi:addiction module HigA family antidote